MRSNLIFVFLGLTDAVNAIFNKITHQLFHHTTWKGYWEPIIQLFLPAWRDSYYRAKVVAIKSLRADVVQLTLSPEKKWPIHKAGQHIALTVEVDGKLITRIFTIACGTTTRKNQGVIRLIIKVKDNGALTPFLSNFGKGNWVNISPPMGSFLLPHSESVLMIAGGSGITPFLAMLEDYQANKKGSLEDKQPIHLIYYAKPHEHLLVEELTEFANHNESFSFQLLSRMHDGDIEPYLVQHGTSHWMVCGPFELHQQVAQTAKLINVPVDSEHFVAFPHLTDNTNSPKQQLIVKHNKTTLTVSNKETLLTQLQKADVPVSYGCGMGICHQCQCIKKSGVVRDVRTGELSDSAEQLIQLCVSQAATDLELQA